MLTSRLGEVVRHLRGAVLPCDGPGPTDRQLLDDYLRRRDDAALEVLVRRHGPMVWGVCRRVLADWHDAEDAFQATWLVLVKKADSLASPDRLANWLYGVARQTALKARATTAKRQARERPTAEPPDVAAPPPDPQSDLRRALDDAVSRLPEKYRVAVILCDLEGQPRKEAARRLGVPEGTVAANLARGRRMLAKMLARRGVGGDATALGPVCLPTTLIASTIEAAAGTISPAVALLTEGVLHAMSWSKIHLAAAVLVLVGLLGSGAGWLAGYALADKPAAPPVKDPDKKAATEVTGSLKGIDAAKGTLRVQVGKGTGEETFTLTGDAGVLLDDGSGDKLAFRDGNLGDLTEGLTVTLRLDADRKVTRVLAEGPTVQGVLKSLDAANLRLVATITAAKGEPGAEQTFALAKTVRVLVEDGKGDKTQPAEAVRLADLPAGAIVSLKLSADRKVVGSIRASGSSVSGTLKAVDAAKGTITLTNAVKGQADTETTLTVAKTATIMLGDGKAKGEAVALAALPIGARVSARLSLDGKTVVSLRADGANVQGNVKGVDAAKNTITLSDKAQDEKVYSVAKDVAVYLDGKAEARKLADVPAGASVQLTLSTDGKVVREIRVNGPTVQGAVVGAANDTVTLRDKEGERGYTLGRDTRIVIEGTREGKLADLIDGTVARVRLSADRSAVLEIHAEGPSYRGIVKVIDPEKGLITLTIGGKGGVGGEDRDFKLTKDTAFVTEINGVPLKPADVKPEREVFLRLTIDQKAVGRVVVRGE